MAREIKTTENGGVKVESVVSELAKKKFKKWCKSANTTQAQVIRDYIQSLTKNVRLRK